MNKPKVLFVCHANVGRSQMAQGVYEYLYGRGTAASAGVLDLREKYNGVPRGDIIQVMAEVGIDISHHTVKPLTQEMIDSAQVVYVLCKPELCNPMLLTGDKKIQFYEVPDPADSTLEGVREVRDLIREYVYSLPRS